MHPLYKAAPACSGSCRVVQMMKPICVNIWCGVAVNSVKNFNASTQKHESKHDCSLPPSVTVVVNWDKTIAG